MWLTAREHGLSHSTNRNERTRCALSKRSPPVKGVVERVCM